MFLDKRYWVTNKHQADFLVSGPCNFWGPQGHRSGDCSSDLQRHPPFLMFFLVAGALLSTLGKGVRINEHSSISLMIGYCWLPCWFTLYYGRFVEWSFWSHCDNCFTSFFHEPGSNSLLQTPVRSNEPAQWPLVGSVVHAESAVAIRLAATRWDQRNWNWFTTNYWNWFNLDGRNFEFDTSKKQRQMHIRETIENYFVKCNSTWGLCNSQIWRGLLGLLELLHVTQKSQRLQPWNIFLVGVRHSRKYQNI